MSTSIGIRFFFSTVIILLTSLLYFVSVQFNVEFTFTSVVKKPAFKLVTKQALAGAASVIDLEDTFKYRWLRLHKARVDWRATLVPCKNVVAWRSSEPGWEKEFRSSGTDSFVHYMDIRPAGGFTRIFIHTRTKKGKDKRIGGDSWRVSLKGPSSVSATVFDHQNGTYEAIALIMEPGEYVVEATLDYSLCDGIKDPPENWFRVGNAQGKFQPSGMLGFLDDYLVEPLQGSKTIKIQVPPSDDNSSRINDLLNIGCRETCNALWDGYGRWIKNKWMPYIAENTSETKRQATTFPNERNGTLWIYGDSLGYRLHISLSSKLLCTRIFRSCRRRYNWVYPVPQENERRGKILNDNFDFRPSLVLESIRDVLRSSDMQKAESLLVLNLGIHYTMVINFTSYQNLITDIIQMLKYRKKNLGSEARVIWKTSTAIHKEKVKKTRNVTHSRFFTDQRVRLFDTYAMSAMCKAGIEILDVYHLTASYPKDTIDNVHYQASVFHKAEMAIQRYSTSSSRYKPRQVCIG